MKCPHCKGELKEGASYVEWKYECLRCSRCWIILDDYWLACFDAGGHVYRLKDGVFEDCNSFKDETLREQLWKRAKGGE